MLMTNCLYLNCHKGEKRDDDEDLHVSFEHSVFNKRINNEIWGPRGSNL